MLVPILLMFGIFYFVLILPERKKSKQRKSMLDAIKKGDRVMTTSGIIAKVVSVAEEEIRLEIADGVRVQFSPSGHPDRSRSFEQGQGEGRVEGAGRQRGLQGHVARLNARGHAPDRERFVR